jgi:hypothetical protein
MKQPFDGLDMFAVPVRQEEAPLAIGVGKGVEDLPADKEVVSPAWRELNKIRNSLQSKLRYRQTRFAEMTIHPKAEEDTEKILNHLGLSETS